MIDVSPDKAMLRSVVSHNTFAVDVCHDLVGLPRPSQPSSGLVEKDTYV